VSHEQQEILFILERIADTLDDVDAKLSQLLPKQAKSSTLTFLNAKGEKQMANAHVNDKPGSYKYQEFDGPNGTGNPVPPTGTVAYASDNPAVATIDPASGQLAYVGAGTTNISASDSGNLPATDVLTLSAAAAVSSTLVFTPGQ
jgi:hypothetical protein